MIELLRYEFPDSRIRLYAINFLNQLDDFTLNRYLLQLVQALKNELHHNSFLARFLMFRALRNPVQIGHFFFWHLKSEYSSMGWCERFGLLIEEYLLHLPNNLEHIGVHYSKELLYQQNLMDRFAFISNKIQEGKKKRVSKTELQQFLTTELNSLNLELGYKQKTIGLPLNPAYRVVKLQVPRCRFMSSAKAPLWLVFTNADQYAYLYPLEMKQKQREQQQRKFKSGGKKKKKGSGKSMRSESSDAPDELGFLSHDIQVMYKYGDDLRQDILTLQIIGVMDAFWLSKNADLRMKPYQVIQTGYQCGMVELVLDAQTTNDIHTKYGGSTLLSSFNREAHLMHLRSNAGTDENRLRALQENYARSCAGYSVATWVLGIGDRHPDNIMIDKNGVLFHIDFGHFLGNFKSKKIVGMKINRANDHRLCSHQ